jgi:hypothetical protein
MDLATATEHRDAWLAADLALAANLEYTISTPGGTRHLKRTDAAEVRNQLAYWNRAVKNATAIARGQTPGYAVASWC